MGRSMPVRMSKARLRSNPNEFVTAEQYTRSVHGSAICISHGCQCRLTHVPRGTRQLDDREVKVAAYFKRRVGSDHSLKCRFNIQATVNKLVAYSMPAVNFENIFEKVDDKKVLFRLNISTEAINVVRAIQGTQGNKYEEQFRACNYVRSPRVLIPYLRSTKAIVALAARLQDKSELSKLVNIRQDGNDIKWQDFYYEYGDYERLYRRLFSDKGVIHPVIVIAHAKQFSPYDASTLMCWFKRATRRGVEINIQPKVAFLTSKLSSQIKLGNSYAICAVPTLRDVNNLKIEKVDPGKRPFAYINLEVVSQHQIALCK